MIPKTEVQEVAAAYGLEDAIVQMQPYGNGHINDTILLTCKQGAGEGYQKRILQRINTDIFKNPNQLMSNIDRVTKWLRGKIEDAGGDVTRQVLQIIPTKDGELYYVSKSGQAFRMYDYIEGGICLDIPRTAADMYESGIAFGTFQGQLADFPAAELYETIPNFHNTKKRFEAFETAVAEDVCQLAHSVREEIEFALSQKPEVLRCMECKKSLPLRVTHNDTKLNNAMLDADSAKALCVLDLDTVMPGYAMDDFGDGIRVGASTALEDEKDLSKVAFDLTMFRAFAEGFINGAKGRLTREELLLFPLGAKMMTYECGIRFLMDYLQGNIYFKVAYPEHNLVRARNQFALVKDMDRKMDEMNQIMVEFANL